MFQINRHFIPIFLFFYFLKQLMIYYSLFLMFLKDSNYLFLRYLSKIGFDGVGCVDIIGMSNNDNCLLSEYRTLLFPQVYSNLEQTDACYFTK